MFGSTTFKVINGKWDHVGYRKTTNLPVSGTTVLPKGTWLDEDPTDEFETVLASGNAIGFTTQAIDANGMGGLQGFQNMMIGKVDNPMKVGKAISLRRMQPNSELEFEGLGGALPGNLVATSGTGLIAADAAAETELSVFNGCLRVAQNGDMVLMHLVKVETAVTAGNRRVRVRVVSPYPKA